MAHKNVKTFRRFFDMLLIVSSLLVYYQHLIFELFPPRLRCSHEYLTSFFFIKVTENLFYLPSFIVIYLNCILFFL